MSRDPQWRGMLEKPAVDGPATRDNYIVRYSIGQLLQTPVFGGATQIIHSNQSQGLKFIWTWGCTQHADATRLCCHSG